MATKIPGCTEGCGKTAHGGKTKNVTVEKDARYQVMSKTGEPLGSPYRSVVAATTFMHGHPGSTLADLLKAARTPT